MNVSQIQLSWVTGFLFLLQVVESPFSSAMPLDQLLLQKPECARLLEDLEDQKIRSVGAVLANPSKTDLRGHQADRLEDHLKRLKSGQVRADQIARLATYAFTKTHERRTTWSQKALAELQRVTGFDIPFGVHYDQKRNKTLFVAMGSPERVAGIRLLIFKNHDDDFTEVEVELNKLSGVNDEMAWVAELDGPLVGQWYQYLYRSVPGATSDSKLPAPETYVVRDPMAPFPDRSHEGEKSGRARIWYPPLHQRPNEPVGAERPSELPHTILEAALADLGSLPDVQEADRGSVMGAQQSPFFQRLISPYSMVEYLPVGPAREVDMFPENLGTTMYMHYWRYMPESLVGIASEFGGPDAMAAHIAEMASKGKGVARDVVYQHTANPPPGPSPELDVFRYAVPQVYLCNGRDYTGCGNTTNLALGNFFTKLAMQALLYDLYMMGFKGLRFDLGGAIPADTMRVIADITKRAGAFITAEPYGAFDHFWTRWDGSIPEIPVWDDAMIREWRRGIANQAPFGAFVKWLSGGNLFYWAQLADHRMAVAEVHDNETQFHFFAKSFGPERALELVRYSNTLLGFVQGDLTMTISQLFGIDAHLDNTPIDLSKLTPQQIQLAEDARAVVALREHLISFFAYQYFDEGDSRQYVQLREDGHNSGWVWLKKPALPDPRLEEGQEVALVFNNSDNSTLPSHEMALKTMTLPDGEWHIAFDSSHTLVVGEQVRSQLRLPAFTAVWLTRKPVATSLLKQNH